MPKRIAILLHEFDKRSTARRCFVHRLAEEWSRGGLEVEIAYGTPPDLCADVIFAHLDLTVVPERYQRYLELFPAVVNRSCVNIAKTRISRNLLGPEDEYPHPVIVKTDLNCGGASEKRLNARRRDLVTRVAAAARLLVPGNKEAPRWRAEIDTGRYPIFPDLGSVPLEVFRDRRLVVEKFLPERDGDDYCLRYYWCLGDHTVNRLLRSRDPIIKGSKVHTVEDVPVPDAILEAQARLGLDYGKLDYVVRDGQVVLLDVSRTPGYIEKPWALPVQEIAPGIQRFFAST